MADAADHASLREQQLIDEALMRVRIALDGSAGDGYCRSCGDEIPAERLARVPTAYLCVPCGTLAERRRGVR